MVQNNSPVTKSGLLKIFIIAAVLFFTVFYGFYKLKVFSNDELIEQFIGAVVVLIVLIVIFTIFLAVGRRGLKGGSAKSIFIRSELLNESRPDKLVSKAYMIKSYVYFSIVGPGSLILGLYLLVRSRFIPTDDLTVYGGILALTFGGLMTWMFLAAIRISKK